MNLTKIFSHIESGCQSGTFLGFPSWNKYLHTHKVNDVCNVQISEFNDIWRIAAAILELLLRLGSVVAVFFIFWGAFSLMMAQGEPDRIKSAKSTIVNAVVGLVITLMAATIVSVIVGRLWS